VRRSRGEAAPMLERGELRLDPASRTVLYRGQPVELQAKEFNLLHELLLNAGRVLSREQIEERLYAWGEEVESNAIEVHVHHLRRKLAPGIIRTVRGVGYMVPKQHDE
jgi:DNA-binding response OmpR family regulator